jgi:hypothetical protein
MARVKNNPEEAELARIFSRSGYVRVQNPDRLEEGASHYKKGDEVRLIAESATELKAIRRLLRAAEFSPGKAYLKHKRWCQPLYGRVATGRFMDIVKRAPKS